MSWATEYITELQLGNTVQFRPRGNSMEGKIESGQLVTVEPMLVSTVIDDHNEVIELKIIKKHDIVLCKVNGKQYLHLVSAIRGNQYQISNNKGFINGWITINEIFGKCVKVEK
jgi:exosome complex RNA-binding protein Rrp4